MNEDTLRDMSDDALFYGRHRDDDGDCHEGEPDATLSLPHDEWLKLQGLTQEDYDRQCDDLIQMHREDWELKRQEAAERARRWTWYGY